MRDGIVEAQLPFFDELHDRRRGRDDFRERGKIENGVGGHRLACWDQRALTGGFLVNDPAAMRDNENGAGDFVVVDRGLQNGIKDGEGGDVGAREGSRRRLLRLLRARRRCGKTNFNSK